MKDGEMNDTHLLERRLHGTSSMLLWPELCLFIPNLHHEVGFMEEF